ncbi:MAG: hypothetical protein AAGJ81_16180, partial [Verrucomicrobiota bacterium]
EALVQSDIALSQSHALSCRQCVGGDPAYAWEWEFDSRAAVVLWGWNMPAAVLGDREGYTESYLESQLEALEMDRGLMRG